MLQRILADTVWAKGLLAMFGFGVFIRLITIVSYKRMRSAAENAGKTKKRWVATLRKRFENYEKFKRMGNVEVFVDRFFERKGILGIPLPVWDKAVFLLSLFSFLVGMGGAFYSYLMNFGAAKTITTLFSATLVSGTLLLLHHLGGTKQMKEEIVTALKDYLANGCVPRASRENLRDKPEEKKAPLPTREEVEGLSEAAVTEEERQVLLEVLEEYFW